MSKPRTVNYQAIKDELGDILSKLQDEDLDIDEAVELYERGQQLTKELQSYLRTAQNKVKHLKPRYGTNGK